MTTRSVFAQMITIGGDEPGMLLRTELDQEIKLPFANQEATIRMAPYLYQWIRLVGKTIEKVESQTPGRDQYAMDYSEGKHYVYHPKFQYLFDKFKGRLLLLFRGLCKCDDKIFEDKLEFHTKACHEFIKQWEEEQQEEGRTIYNG